VCRGMPFRSWGTCGAGPDGGLVGFLWGACWVPGRLSHAESPASTLPATSDSTACSTGSRTTAARSRTRAARVRGTPATQLLTARTKGPARADARRQGRPTARGPHGRIGPGRSGPRHRHQTPPPPLTAPASRSGSRSRSASSRARSARPLGAGHATASQKPAESRTCLTGPGRQLAARLGR
jgi:hypothetical protein